MIWSKHSINEKAGFKLKENGSASPNRIGRFVLTLEECESIMKKNRDTNVIRR